MLQLPLPQCLPTLLPNIDGPTTGDANYPG